MTTTFEARLLRWLTGFYYPFVFLVCFIIVGLIVLFGYFFMTVPFFQVFFAILIVFLALSLAQVLWTLPVLFMKPEEDRTFDIRLPPKKFPGLYEFVGGIARERELEPPHEIRIAADTIACVFQDEAGRQVLKLGGPALTLLSSEALAGVVAHELGHITAGDTHWSRKGFERRNFMFVLDQRFRMMSGAIINPFIGLIRIYHRVYDLVWAICERQQEFAADKHEVAQSGKEVAAAALIYLVVTEELPWVRLYNVAESSAASGVPLDNLFTEQRERFRRITTGDWEDACSKALGRETAMLDTHPSLKERLKAMGVSPKKALKYALKQLGTPACEMIPNWNAIEKELTQRVMVVVRSAQRDKQEMGQILARW